MIKFANQTRALSFFEHHLYNEEPFFYIVEPAQMGKSALMHQVSDYCANSDFLPYQGEEDDTKPTAWWQIVINTPTACGKGSLTPTKLFKAIIKEMGCDGAAKSDTVIMSLVQGMNDSRKRAIFLIDGAEHMSEEVASSLFALFDKILYAFEFYPHFRPAAIIGGRRAFAAWENYHPKMKRLELSPFEPSDIVAILRVAKGGTVPLSNTDYLELAKRIFASSMGHPGCTATVVSDLCEKRFLEHDPGGDTYFQGVVAPFIKKQILTREHLVNHRKSSSSEQKLLIQVLWELSTYRIIVPDWIESTVRGINGRVSQQEISRLEVQICTCPLVAQDDRNGWYVLSPSIRRLLERWLTVEHHDREQRHLSAAERYENWLDNHEESAARRAPALQDSVALLVEVLFHLTLTTGLQTASFMEHMQERFERNLEKLVPWFPRQAVSAMVHKRLANDAELHNIMVARTSENDYRLFLNKYAPPGA